MWIVYVCVQAKPRINFFAISIKCGCSNGETSILRSEINYSFFWTSLSLFHMQKSIIFEETCCLLLEMLLLHCTFLWTKCCIKKFLYEWITLHCYPPLFVFYYQHHHSVCQLSLFYSSSRIKMCIALLTP